MLLNWSRSSRISTIICEINAGLNEVNALADGSAGDIPLLNLELIAPYIHKGLV